MIPSLIFCASYYGVRHAAREQVAGMEIVMNGDSGSASRVIRHRDGWFKLMVRGGCRLLLNQVTAVKGEPNPQQ